MTSQRQIKKDRKAIIRIHFLPTGQKEKESRKLSSIQQNDKKGRVVPQKRQASLSPMPKKTNGLNPLIIHHHMIHGKPTVPFGTGIRKTTG